MFLNKGLEMALTKREEEMNEGMIYLYNVIRSQSLSLSPNICLNNQHLVRKKKENYIGWSTIIKFKQKPSLHKIVNDHRLIVLLK